jgi:multicomponent Na+:H+ antiporter subunit E
MFVIWMVISNGNLPDLPAGVLAAVLGSWASLRVRPPGFRRVDVGALLWLCLRVVRQSVIAGVDIARRALAPSLPLSPGLIRYRSKVAPGSAQAAFSTIISMVPGTLPLGPAPEGIMVHCLDTAQPVAAGLAQDEALWLRAFGGARSNG